MNLLVWCDIKRVRKVESDKLIRDCLGVGLKEAKDYVDFMLNGDTVLLSFKSQKAIDVFKNKANDFGLMYCEPDD